MKKLLAFLFVVAVGIVALGFYRGWFHVATSSNGNREGVELSVDKDKVREDKDKAEKQLRQAGEDIKDKTRGPSDKSKEENGSKPSANPTGSRK